MRWQVSASEWQHKCMHCGRNCREGVVHRYCLERHLNDLVKSANWRATTDPTLYFMADWLDEPTQLELRREVGLRE